MNAASSTLPAPRLPRPWLFALGGLLVLAFLPIAARWSLEMGLRWPCAARDLFGLPCPSCGGTRALAALSHGNIGEALRFNPFVIIGLALLLLLPRAQRIPPRWKSWGWPVFFAAAGANWLYLLFNLPR